MSAFAMHRREGAGAIDIIHVPTGAVYLRLYPYYDLWPVDRRITRWGVVWFPLAPKWLRLVLALFDSVRCTRTAARCAEPKLAVFANLR